MPETTDNLTVRECLQMAVDWHEMSNVTFENKYQWTRTPGFFMWLGPRAKAALAAELERERTQEVDEEAGAALESRSGPIAKCWACGGEYRAACLCLKCASGADIKRRGLLPFDYDRAKAGAKVCLADGTVVECEFSLGAAWVRVPSKGPLNPPAHLFSLDGVHLLGVRLYMAPEPPRPAEPTSKPKEKPMVECHKLDTQDAVFFYEQDFYVLSNFSAFMIEWKGHFYPTSEHAYQSEKFPSDPSFQTIIRGCMSAHEAFKLATHPDNKCFVRSDWNSVKVDIMREILRAKVQQHEYVRRKLLATGDRTLFEDSWRDDFWGWGPNKDGSNMLGRLWMEIRDELRKPAEPEPFDKTA